MVRSDSTAIKPELAGTLDVAGIALRSDPTGAAWHAAERVLLVADIHFEKGSAFARHGQMLPPFDTSATLAALETVVRRYNPKAIVALGDSFHDVGGFGRMSGADRAKLGEIQKGRDWIWISGNHDPSLPREAGGERHDVFHLGPLVMRHAPLAGPCQGEIAGHYHPVARIAGRRRRCFVSDGSRLVMPAFGAYAGGLNIHDKEIGGLFAGRKIAHVIGGTQVYSVCASRCARD